MSQCNTCNNGNSCTTCKQNGYYFDLNTLGCASCGFGCSVCSNATYCTICGDNKNNTQYTLLLNGSCILNSAANISSSLTHCLQNKYINNTLKCVICQSDYYQQIGDSICHYGCSVLCNSCNGAHYGLCNSCIANTILVNRHCIPKYNINNGTAYQIYLTAFHNFNNNTFTNITPLITMNRLNNTCLK